MNDSIWYSRAGLLESLEDILPAGWRPSQLAAPNSDPFDTHPILSIQLSDALHAARRAQALVSERSSDRMMIARMVELADQVAAARPSIDDGNDIRAGGVAVVTCMRNQAERLLAECGDDENVRNTLRRLIEQMDRREQMHRNAIDETSSDAADEWCRNYLLQQMIIISRQFGLTVTCSINQIGRRTSCSAFLELVLLLAEAAGFETDPYRWQADYDAIDA